MAKLSSINKNLRRQALSKKHAARRKQLKDVIYNKSASMEDRFTATLKLAQMPRNGAANRVRNRCALTGRARAVYRKFQLSRIMVRELGNQGLIPGLVKSSW